ncbi:MAG TPA: RagB/SusD family nutrient uptake outer membrane protein, partial [Porphyromonadaceae bacterium]|nr:RagB/SusD family nutrient uptake outer membrane protein [Porphyromonadaceae bacterium]
MKSINIFKIPLLGVALGVAVTSCDLNVVPPSDIAAETYWQSERDAWYNLNTIYQKIVPETGAHTDSYSDDVYCQYSWESNGSVFIQDGFSPLYDAGWNFEGIRRTNIFLKEIENCSMSEELKTRFKAEARALRAWEYLDKTLLFGKVPIVTEVLAYNADNVPRDEVSKVREFVLSELTEAAKDLPESYSGGYPNEKGRITKYAALSLKARAALYFGDYALAESTAKEVMDNGGYSLFRISTLSAAQQKEADEMNLYVDFDKYGIDKDKFVKGMFSFEALWFNENGTVDNPEYIMTRQNAPVSSWDYQDMVRYTSMRPNQLGGWSSVTPTQNLVDAYWVADGKSKPALPTKEARSDAYRQIKTELDAYTPPAGRPKFLAFVEEKVASGDIANYKYIEEFRNRDSRMYVSILMPFKGWYESNYGNDFAYEWIKGGNNESKTGFNFRKMLVLENDPANYGQATGDYPCIRYAEILLIYAEARTQTTGYDSQVQAALNQLRDRCGMPDVPASLSKTEALEFIKTERRIELAAEGFRPFD